MELQMKDYMKMIKKRLWMIVSLVLSISVLTGVVSYKFIQPVYEASVKLIVTKAQDFQGTQVIDYGSIDVNIKLVNTYKEIIKTPAIMDKVVQQYPSLGLDSTKLIEMVKVNSENESQVMTISVEDVSYDRGAQIVNAIAEVFKNQIPTIMKIDNVTVLNEANQAIRPLPVKPNSELNIAISFILSLIVTLCLVFIFEYLDDSIKTEQDVKNYLGIPTLGVISKIKSKEMNVNSAAVTQITGGDSTYVSTNQ